MPRESDSGPRLALREQAGCTGRRSRRLPSAEPHAGRVGLRCRRAPCYISAHPAAGSGDDRLQRFREPRARGRRTTALLRISVARPCTPPWCGTRRERKSGPNEAAQRWSGAFVKGPRPSNEASPRSRAPPWLHDELELDPADANDVTVAERGGPDPRVIDDRPVAAPEVVDDVRLAFPRDRGMPPGDVR